MDQMFARALNQVMNSDWTDTRELARAAGCSMGHLCKVRNGETQLGLDKAMRLSRFCAKHGHYQLAECFITPELSIVERGPGRANGTLDDERKRMIELFAALDKEFDDRDQQEARERLADLKQVLADAETEVDRL